MNKSKILAVALSAALVGSMAAATALTASAAGVGNAEQIKDHTVGVTGSFANWGNPYDDGHTVSDTALTDEDGDGVYEGTIEIESATEDMIVEHTKDDGNENQVPTGKVGITFKVRLDGDWTDSWGEFEPDYGRTWNSQTNCCADGVKVGDSVKIHVTFDTTKNSPEAIANGDVEEGDDVDVYVLPVTYTVEIGAGSTEESSAAESSAESSVESSTESSQESSTAAATTTSSTASTATSTAPAATTDTTTPATGDTTSAVALVAVVLASLGASVVMTKKASAKD